MDCSFFLSLCMLYALALYFYPCFPGTFFPLNFIVWCTYIYFCPCLILFLVRFLSISLSLCIYIKYVSLSRSILTSCINNPLFLSLSLSLSWYTAGRDLTSRKAYVGPTGLHPTNIANYIL